MLTSAELPPPWETLTSSDPAYCGPGQVSETQDCFNLVGSSVNSRDAAAPQVRAQSPSPSLEGLTHRCCRSAAGEPPTCPCPPCAQPADGSANSPASVATSLEATPDLTQRQPSLGERSLQGSISPGTSASTDSASAASGQRGSLRGERGLESSSEKASPSPACQPWLQMDAERLLPGPSLSILHGKTTHLTALRNSLEERHTKQPPLPHHQSGFPWHEEQRQKAAS